MPIIDPYSQVFGDLFQNLRRLERPVDLLPILRGRLRPAIRVATLLLH